MKIGTLIVIWVLAIGWLVVTSTVLNPLIGRETALNQVNGGETEQAVVRLYESIGIKTPGLGIVIACLITMTSAIRGLIKGTGNSVTTILLVVLAMIMMEVGSSLQMWRIHT